MLRERHVCRVHAAGGVVITTLWMLWTCTHLHPDIDSTIFNVSVSTASSTRSLYHGHSPTPLGICRKPVLTSLTSNEGSHGQIPLPAGYRGGSTYLACRRLSNFTAFVWPTRRPTGRGAGAYLLQGVAVSLHSTSCRLSPLYGTELSQGSFAGRTRQNRQNL